SKAVAAASPGVGSLTAVSAEGRPAVSMLKGAVVWKSFRSGRLPLLDDRTTFDLRRFDLRRAVDRIRIVFRLCVPFFRRALVVFLRRPLNSSRTRATVLGESVEKSYATSGRPSSLLRRTTSPGDTQSSRASWKTLMSPSVAI